MFFSPQNEIGLPGFKTHFTELLKEPLKEPLKTLLQMFWTICLKKYKNSSF